MIIDRKWPGTLDKTEDANLGLAAWVSLLSEMAGRPNSNGE
jgi:hypothetical protein